ncbi:DNA-binding response regulator [Paenibacillus sp. 598K]|uniref:response regulator transcription factor n=1 Tax=Paenibacillus sp. 598K TaxID=1117987 RepID=UPI000FF9ACE1|nr:helix-turn-helix domain-containing protein [Paenibacillus sp. 598K]GBF78217.1 DNA-binding response regulator [Paenibacillus sp. 598K]
MHATPLRVVIADDELPLREELRLLPWASYAASLVGEACNGQEALSLCRELQPDVLITDITMPVMDGMTLIRELRAHCPAVRIILLTCHSDFRYVQDALRLGAVAYILKVALDDGELVEALGKAREAIAADQHSRRSIRSEQRARLAGLLAKLLQRQTPGDREWQAVGLAEEERYRLVQLYRIAEAAAVQASRPAIELRLAQDESDERQWAFIGEQGIYLLLRDGPEQETWLAQALPALLSDMHRLLLSTQLSETATVPQSYPSVLPQLQALTHQASQPTDITASTDRLGALQPSVYAVVSEPLVVRDALGDALLAADRWRDQLFYADLSDIGLRYGASAPIRQLDESGVQQLQEPLRWASGSAERLCRCLAEDFADRCRELRPDPGQLKQRMMVWLVDWLRQQDAVAEPDGLRLDAMIDAQTLSQLICRLTDAIRTWDQGQYRYRLEVRQAFVYIRDHLQAPLTLQLIAEQVGLSPHHLSRLFREETGSTVGETITRLRMEKAVELLSQTNMKVYEVAERIGIPSYRYFTQLFRKWTGLAPTDYKRQP